MRRVDATVRTRVGAPLQAAIGLVVVGALLSVVGSAPAEARSPTSLVSAVNAERSSRGLPALKIYGDDTMARRANDEMIRTGEFHGLDGVASWYLDKGAKGFRSNQAIFPDVVASAERVIDVWLDSPGHAANLHAPDATHIAAAVRSVDGATYYTAHILVDLSAPSPPEKDESEDQAPSAPPEGVTGSSADTRPPADPDPAPDPEPAPQAAPTPPPLRAPMSGQDAVDLGATAAGPTDGPYIRTEVAPQVLTAPPRPGTEDAPDLRVESAAGHSAEPTRSPTLTAPLAGLLPLGLGLALVAIRGRARRSGTGQPPSMSR